jgi:hypothetical protein
VNRLFRFAALGAALTAPLALHAKPVEEKAILSGKVKLDPTMGYIFVSGAERQFGLFLRVPDAETWKVYEEDRQKAFAKAQKRYPSQLANWRSQVEIARQTKKTPPEPPEEPKLETFAIDPIELRDTESFGPFFVYAKGETVSYLNAVKPGTWIWYGPLMMAPNGGATGACYCLGSVRFQVKAGVVTDLGTSLQDAPRWDEEMDVGRLTLKQTNEKRIAAGKEPLKTGVSGVVKYGLPASLKNWPAVRGELMASPKMNNYYGALVTRVAPIPGVLGYRRDMVVDLRTGQDIDSPTLVSRAKIKK